MRFGDLLVVCMYLIGAAFLAALVLVAVGYMGAADYMATRIDRARRWMALRIGGRTVRPSEDIDGELVAELRRMVRDEPCQTAAPWTWDELPSYMPGSVKARYIGTTDPIPSAEMVEAMEGYAVYDDDDEAGRPDPSVILPDDCPGDGCPDRYPPAPWEHESGPDLDSGGEDGRDVGGHWELLGEFPAENDPETCCVVYCQRCNTPSPTFRVRCHKCGAHLTTGEPHAAGDWTSGGAWPFGCDPFSGGACGSEAEAGPDSIPAPSYASNDRPRKGKAKANNWPSVKALAGYLRELKRAGSVPPDGDGATDVRLQVLPDDWRVWTGDPSYDTDHRGNWGAGSLGARTNVRDLARDLIQQAREMEADTQSACDQMEADARALVSGCQ